MFYSDRDRCSLGEMGYWDETLERWRREGLEEDPDKAFAYDYVRRLVPVSLELEPGFREEIVEENGDHRIVQRSDGALIRKHRNGGGMPQWLRYPLTSHRDWEDQFLHRLDPRSESRYPADWAERVKEWNSRNYPLGIQMGSIYGWLRNWMGLQGISLAVYDDPAWIGEMMRYMADFACGCGERALRELDLDYVLLWEDMAGKNGPLLSPELFRELMLKPYSRLTDFIRDHGIELIFVDCDGNAEPLIPLWIEGGVSGIYPLERAAGMDPVAIRRKYGPEFRLMGGVDKRLLAAGPKFIDNELAHVAPLLAGGGYVAWCDHYVPPDVSLKHYRHFVRRKKELVSA
jgi:uroporphyrinogen decarboxylase